MSKVLVPVDGSETSLHAVDLVIRSIAEGRQLQVYLLNVQPQILSGHARMYLKKDLLDEYYKEEGDKALGAAKARLDEAGIPYTVAQQVGNIPEVIARYVKSHGCDLVVMGTRGLGSMHNMAVGSVANRVLHQVEVPVTLVK